MPDKPATLVGLFRSLLKRLGIDGFDGYDPARHYMRGPGPKSRALQQPVQPPGEEPGSARVDKSPDEQGR